MVSRTMVKLYLTCLITISYIACSKAQITENTEILRDRVEVTTPIFTVIYSETLEQPISLIYKSSNRPKNVDRGSMNFYKEDKYHTSDNDDYKYNVWDKGHLAPAATFSDSQENLKQTFSFLNCALQHKGLNRGEWRMLEQAEREWDDTQELIVTIEIEFTDSILPYGATLPKTFTKHINFTKDNVYKCYSFPNEDTQLYWEEYEVVHSHE